MKAVTKAVTATASTGSVVGGGYTIYHFSSAENVSPEEEHDFSFSELKNDEVASKVLKDEQVTHSNETVEDTSEKKSEPKTVSNLKQEQVDNKPQTAIKKPTEEELYKEAISGLTTFGIPDLEDDKYKDKVLGITKESHLPFLVKSEANEKWWEWSFKNKHEKTKNNTTLHPLFSSLKKGFSNTQNDNEALNQACNKAYNKTKEDYSFKENNFLLQNISAFCTKDKKEFDISEPKSKTYSAFKNEDLSHYHIGFLTIDANKPYFTHLYKQDNDYNDLWWDWSYNKIFLPFKKTKSNNLTSAFSSVTSGYSNTLALGSLNKACEEIYKKDLKDIRNDHKSDQLINEIKKFCSINERQRLILVRDQEPDSKKTFSQQEVASDYKNKLLDLFNTKHLSSIVKPIKENEEWWEWAYQYIYLKNNSTKHPVFKSLSSGYSSTDVKSLSKACDLAYQKEKDDFYNNFDLPDGINDFCSVKNKNVYVSEPKHVTHAEDKSKAFRYTKGIMKEDSNKAKLVVTSLSSTNNIDLWWEWAFEKRISKVSKTNLSSLFQVVETGHGRDDSLANACDNAYQKTPEELKKDGNKLFNEIQQFCSVDPSVALVLPN